jgi:hypothetical protein
MNLRTLARKLTCQETPINLFHFVLGGRHFDSSNRKRFSTKIELGKAKKDRSTRRNL